MQKNDRNSNWTDVSDEKGPPQVGKGTDLNWLEFCKPYALGETPSNEEGDEKSPEWEKEVGGELIHNTEHILPNGRGNPACEDDGAH